MTRGYFKVRLGKLDRINLGGTYMYPDKGSALQFAAENRVLYPNRLIIVRDPKGRVIRRYDSRVAA